MNYLVQENANLTFSINEIKKLNEPIDQQSYVQKIHENEAKIALNKAKINSLENFLSNQKKIQADFSTKLKQLQQFSDDDHPLSTQEKIAKITALNEINNRTLDLLTENLNLARAYQDLLNTYEHTLSLWRSKEDMQAQLANLRTQEEKLNISLQDLFDKSLSIQQSLKNAEDFKLAYTLEGRLLLNNQVINLTQQKIVEIRLQKTLIHADYLLLKTPDIRTLQKVTDIYKSAINQLSEMEQDLKKMASILKNEHVYLQDPLLKKHYLALLHIINTHIASITIQEQTLQEDLENHQNELKKQLSIRQSLTDYRLNSWPDIFNQILHMPEQFYHYIKSLSIKVKDSYMWQDKLPKVMMWGVILLTLLGFIYFKKLMKRLIQDKERSRLTTYLYNGALVILDRNIILLSIITVLVEIFYFNQVLLANYLLLLNLLTVWISFRIFILIAHLGLMQRVSDVSGEDVRLFYRLRKLLILGGWITALMVLSYQLPLSLLLQDIFNRLFMLFLMTASIAGWRSKDTVSEMLHPILKSKKTYLRNAMMLLIILTPITLFLTALIGLIGYINLAWTMSQYLLEILLIISGYVLCRGLFFDLLEYFSEWMISRLTNGWLWIEIFLKPLDRIMRLLLLILCFFLLFKLFDWRSNAKILEYFHYIIDYPIVNISGIHITFTSTIEFLVLLSVFIWIAKWTREFCFRWLYRHASDPGIRHSLSVFTQYAVILVGGFLTLRVLGLDFSGMSMILGGFAVGMGFGLRDFASNIVGGLMLLIERPVREGDLITLGTYEGRVSHIGIRSMRVSSWDNMEVLIPNAETFNKPFTNWTHQDSIVRSVIPVKVSRADDPGMIQQLILDVLAIIPEIVEDPSPQVFLKEIDEALIEFEIRYFINVHLNTLMEIRSKVLFAIMAQFKAAGVKSPVPPFSVELKGGSQIVLQPPQQEDGS